MKTKKYITLVFILTALLSQFTYAQKPRGGGGRMKERMQAMKIGYITERLNLNTEEAQRFWPVYNRYSDEMMRLREDAKDNLMDGFADFQAMSDADADKLVNEMISFKVAEADIIRKYAAEFKKVIPIRKVAMLFRAEFDFRKEMLNRLRDRREPDMR